MHTTNNIKKIFVLSDILRGNLGQDYNTPWLYEFVKYFAGSVSSLPISRLVGEEATEFHRAVFKLLNIELSRTAWVEAYSKTPSEELITFLKPYFESTLVIAFELHPIFQKAFDILGVQYIKFMNHPIRYMDDVFFGISSNNAAVYEKIKNYQVNEELYRQYAFIMKAEAAVRKFCKKTSILPNSAVFFAQTNVDCSLLENDHIHDLFDYMDRFKDITEEYDHVYYKVHPMGKNPQIIEYLKQLPKVIICHSNEITAYDFLSSENISKCFSISSGALYEARYFGKQVEYFYKQPFDFINDAHKPEKSIEEIFIPVYKSYWEHSFWADILSPVINIDREVPNLPCEVFSNKFRRILNMNWGYRDYDSVEINKFIAQQKLNAQRKKNKTLNKAYRFIWNSFLCCIPFRTIRRKIRYKLGISKYY